MYHPTTKLEECSNVAFSSTQAMEGEGFAIVIATGDHTLIGTIAGLVTGVTQQQTPVQKEINHFVRILTIFAFTVATIFFFVSGGRKGDWLVALTGAFVIVVVAFIPEGLPLTVLTCLSLAARRMAARNVFIKQLSSVETLGSVSVIASDKTGTLTQNKMTVTGLWFDEMPMTALSVGFTPHPPSQVLPQHSGAVNSRGQGSNTSYHLLEMAALLCNRSKYADERMLSANEATDLARFQVLLAIDGTLNLGQARANFPTLMASIEEGVSLRNALKQYRVADAQSGEVARQVLGDATDKALFEFVAARQHPELLRYHYRTVYEVPFNSRNKFALIIVRPHEVHQMRDINNSNDNAASGSLRRSAKAAAAPTHGAPYTQRMLLMKGAPEVILARCTHYSDRGQTRPVDAEFRSAFSASYRMFGNRGERVLGFAWLELDAARFPPEFDSKYSLEENNFPTAGLTFIGLISLVDPPKPSVPQSVKLCREAGIKVIMVTGDHALTAAAIARQVGILTQPTVDQLCEVNGCALADVPDDQISAIVVEGSKLDSDTEVDWDRTLAKPEIVFARTTPQQKLQIVENLQRLNHCVAVTGDGVNDAPALKKADVGVAMGIMGSDVARDAADAILMDDDFASIVEGVRQGRTIFDNLAKCIAYVESHAIPEAMPVLLYVAFDIPGAIFSLAIVAIDCGTELAPAVALAYESPEADVMKRMPRNRNLRMIRLPQILYMFMAGLLSSAWTWLAYCLVFKHHGVPLSRLPYSAVDAWFAGADPFAIAGPAGCSMDPTAVDSYTPDCVTIDDVRQVQIFNEASAAVFMMIVAFQIFHIFMVKARYVSIFSHPMFENVMMLYGVVIEVMLLLLFIFVPTLNVTLIGLPFPGFVWALPLVAWASLFILSESRKWWTRKYPTGLIAEYFAW